MSFASHAAAVAATPGAMWDRMAPRYHKCEPLTGAYIDLAVRLVAPLVVAGGPDGTVRVLDVAAGTGEGCRIALRQLRALGHGRAVFHATDISPQMLQRCAERWAADHPSDAAAKLTTAVQDMQDMSDVPSGSQDLVLIMFGVMFVDDVAKVLSEVLRVLSPTGIAAVSTWHFNSMTWEVAAALQSHLGKLQGNEDDFVSGILKYGREDVISRLLRKVGLRVGTATDFHQGVSDAFIEFQRADPVPMPVVEFAENFSAPSDAEATVAFVKQNFSRDGATVPVRATALTAVFRRAAVRSLLHA